VGQKAIVIISRYQSQAKGNPEIHEEMEREEIQGNERDRAHSCAFFQIFEIFVVLLLDSGAWF
jgi:hypothetical protein